MPLTLRVLALVVLILARAVNSAVAYNADDDRVEAVFRRMSLEDKVAELQGIRPNDLMVGLC